MAPFVNEKSLEDEKIDISKLDIDMISPNEYISPSNEEGAIFESDDISFEKLKSDKLVYAVGGVAVLCVLGIFAYLFTDHQKSVDVEELPVIKADYRPIKERINAVKSHEDKKIYTYITTGNEQPVKKPQVIKQKDSVVSINELDKSQLTEEDKKMILKAFEDLAPNAKRRRIVQDESITPPKPVLDTPKANVQPVSTSIPKKEQNVNRVVSLLKKTIKKRSNGLNDLIKSYANSNTVPKKKNLKEFLKEKRKTAERGTIDWKNNNIVPITPGSIFVQLASLPSKEAAITEYSRLTRKHKVLNTMGHKFNRVQVGNDYRYRIMIGPFRSKQEAGIAVRKMQDSGLRPLW